MKRAIVAAALTGAGLLGLASPAAAGCIVLKNGEVLVGRIRQAEIKPDDHLMVRWPYEKHPDPELRQKRGEQKVEWFRIRWFDAADEVHEPTDAYWKQFENDPIDNKYLHLLERWRIRQRSQTDEIPIPIITDDVQIGGRLDPAPVNSRYFSIRRPADWQASTDEGITIFVSNQPGTDGFRPRIHVFSTESAIGKYEDQSRWVLQEVARVASDGDFAVGEASRLKTVVGGFNQELVTVTRRGTRKVHALRLVCFRKKRTYFFTAYAHERDFGTMELLLRACMESLKIKEDERAQASR